MILADGVVGQMMEKVTLPAQRKRLTDEEVIARCPWASTGRSRDRKPNIITSLELDPAEMEKRNIHLQQKYDEIQDKEVRFEEVDCEDAEYLIVAFGSCARIAQKAMETAREEGLKIGLLRPITLWPFPTKQVAELAKQVKGILTVELNAGQMIEDVRLAVEGEVPVEHFGRLGGIVPDPDEIIEALKEKLIK
jgi:2-oxoglutarate ferredoxin oxidoreductase subunit alpha